jgi:hypothetical protein
MLQGDYVTLKLLHCSNVAGCTSLRIRLQAVADEKATTLLPEDAGAIFQYASASFLLIR